MKKRPENQTDENHNIQRNILHALQEIRSKIDSIYECNTLTIEKWLNKILL